MAFSRYIHTAFAFASVVLFSAVSLPSAFGGECSSTTHGCHAQWYNTHSKGVYAPADSHGRVQLWADRSFQTDYAGVFEGVARSRTYNPFDRDNAYHGEWGTGELAWLVIQE